MAAAKPFITVAGLRSPPVFRIAGGLIGGLIGHHLVEFNRGVRANVFSLWPTVASDGDNLTFTWSF